MDTSPVDTPRADRNGWTTQRLAVIHRARGVCARCGATGADTVMRAWDPTCDTAELLAAHTRCVVGLGPSVDRRGHDAA